MAQKTIYTLTRKHFYWYGCTTETDVCTLACTADGAGDKEEYNFSIGQAPYLD